MNDYKGTSAVLVNNEKGEYLFQSIIPKITVYKQEPLAYAVAKNSALRDQNTLVLIQRPNDSFTKTKLLEAGYSEGKDYTSKTHIPIIIEQYDLSEGPYCDQYGNSVDGSRGI